MMFSRVVLGFEKAKPAAIRSYGGGCVERCQGTAPVNGALDDFSAQNIGPKFKEAAGGLDLNEKWPSQSMQYETNNDTIIKYGTLSSLDSP